MSNLSTFAEVGLVDARASAGTLVLPSSRDIPGRVITFKDIYGAVGNSTIALIASTGDVFEDGTSYRTLTNPYDFITLYAGSTNVWYTIGGTVVNGFRAALMSNSSNVTSSITATTINSGTTFTSFLYPQTGLTTTITSNLVPPANATLTTGSYIGQPTLNYWQIYSIQTISQSTITSNIGASLTATSTVNINASLTPAYSTSRISTISLGTNTNRYFQTFAVSTITSSITTDLAAVQTLSTQNIIGFNLLGTTILSTQQLFCSSIQIGPTDSILDILGPLRTQDLSTLTLQASTITSGTMTLDRLFNGPVLTATTTQNLYPFNVGALVGFGSNTSQNGYYAEGHFRSTFTQVIQPTLDNDGFSNVVRIQGVTSTQQIITSTITANNILTTGNNTAINYVSSLYIRTDNLIGANPGNPAINSGSLYPLLTNAQLGYGGGFNASWLNMWSRNFYGGLYRGESSDNNSTINIRHHLVASTITTSTITMNVATGQQATISSVNTNTFTVGSVNGYVNTPFLQTILTSSIQINTSILNVSSVNQKRYPYASTLNMPASTFSLSGTAANNITVPLVLYSNVSFPHAGFFNTTQSAIFSRTSGTTNVPQASIFYTPGIYPSTISNVDGYTSLPYLGNADASTFTTLCETLYVSTTQLTRNIIYSDPTGNAYTANLFMSPITFNYIPNNSILPE